jgi:hypothetical protein
MRASLIALGLLLVTGCAAKTTVVRADFTQGEGAYVVGYAADPAIRTRVEEQLVSDLRAREMIAFASHPDIPDITSSSRYELIAAARKRGVISVIVINQVSGDASDSVVQNPKRISPTHPDLRSFYEYSRDRQTAIEPGQQVFAEVNLFVLDGDKANLFWSGTTWSFQADGQGTAIRGISETIANQLQKVRDQSRANPFTP